MIKNQKTILDWTAEVLHKCPTSTFYLWFPFGRARLLTANPKNIQHIMKMRFKDYPKSRNFESKAFIVFIENITKKEIDGRLFPLLSDAADKKTILDFQDILRRFTFDVVAMLGLGHDLAYLTPSLPEMEFGDAIEISWNRLQLTSSDHPVPVPHASSPDILEKSSGGISAIFMLIAGILTTLLTLDFLIKMKLDVNALLHFRDESSIELHFRLNDDVDRGGRPADETWERLVIWKPEESEGCKLSVSPVSDEMNEPGEDVAWEAEKLMVVDDSFRSGAGPFFSRRKPTTLRLRLRKQSDKLLNALKPSRGRLLDGVFLHLSGETAVPSKTIANGRAPRGGWMGD
nr:cytochrome P450 94A2-like [Ipomoea trifida]